ncbi:MAG: sensor histidine kinase [Chloroflexota bacterium]
MDSKTLALIFFPYGLAFFSMGLVVALEGGRGSDIRLRHALRPLAGFGLIHGIHEWLEMLQGLELLPWQNNFPLVWEAVRLALLAFSFLSLGAFGASLLSPSSPVRRISLLVPLVQVTLWGFGVMSMHGKFPGGEEMWNVADVWTRYILGVPSALVACVGLIVQQRAFRRAGMEQFGRDSLWAAVAFAWYGLIGQMFTRESLLFPSRYINQALFLHIFGFPVQILRATAAIVAAAFIIRFLRSFEVERQRQIADLQAARLREAQRREALRGDLLRRVVAAQESERQRVARELHDETGQALIAIGLGLRGVSTEIKQNKAQAVENLKNLEELVLHSLDELQRLVADLRPSHLDDLGLAAALRWYASDVMKRVPLGVHVEVSGEPRPLSAPIKIALFRIAQEALTNVIKHAEAAEANIQLRFTNSAVSVRIEDNGRGFDVDAATSSGMSSWGLLGMRERASLLGGNFTLQSQPGAGTCVEVVIPYEQRKTRIGREESDDDTSDIG